jgi:asparagine synthase (glutamine-hydrolysing)
VGFTVPVASWMRGSLKPVMDDLLTSDASRIRSLLPAREMARILDQHASGRFNYVKILWALANLEMFLRAFDILI